MDITVKELITLYGPLGLGWPFAFYLLRELLKIQREVREISGRWITSVDALTHAVDLLRTACKDETR